MIASLNTWARPGCPSAPSRAPIREPCGALDRPFPGEVPHAHKRKVSDIRLQPARDLLFRPAAAGTGSAGLQRVCHDVVLICLSRKKRTETSPEWGEKSLAQRFSAGYSGK